MRALLAVVGAAVASVVAFPAVAQPMQDWSWHGQMGFGFGGLFWVLVIAAIAFWVARRGRMPWFDVPFGTQGAMNILRERYAKGEISAEEFDERRKKLSD